MITHSSRSDDTHAPADAPPSATLAEAVEVSKICVLGALVPALIGAREKLVIACQFQRTLDLLEVILFINT